MKRILIVDDDDAMRGLLRVHLEDSFEVIDTGVPEEALALALEHKPDAILLDLMMPKFSGFELCQTMSSLSFTQLMPIFIVSGQTAAKYRTFCKDLGASGYFEKPVDFEALKARLNEVLGGQRPERRSEVRVRLRIPLKLRGTDAKGAPVDQITTTDNVSRSGFLCGCTAPLQVNSVLDVYLVREHEECVGRARVVRSEACDTPCPRYGFRFVEKQGQWVLQ